MEAQQYPTTIYTEYNPKTLENVIADDYIHIKMFQFNNLSLMQWRASLSIFLLQDNKTNDPIKLLAVYIDSRLSWVPDVRT